MRHDEDPTNDEAIGAAIRRIAAGVDAPDDLRRRVAARAAGGGASRRPIARRRLAVGLAAAGIGATAGVGVVWWRSEDRPVRPWDGWPPPRSRLRAARHRHPIPRTAST